MNRRPPTLVVIGASAGGVEALKPVVADLPERMPAAVAVVLHLTPQHPSVPASILDRRTALDVKQAEEADVLEASQVYVLLPTRTCS